MSDPGDPAPQAPVLRVLTEATDEEVAALVVVLSALGGPAPAPRRTPSAWSAPARGVRRPLPHGAGAWRTSSLPR